MPAIWSKGGRLAVRARQEPPLSRQPPSDVVAAAQAAMRATGVPASVTLAQWVLESGWGDHEPPTSHNPFGIKAVGDQPYVPAKTVEIYNGVSKIITAKFRIFESEAQAFIYHADLLTHSQYHAAMAVIHDPLSFADKLTGVYATDPNYGDKLKTLIIGNRLLQYDTVQGG